MFWKKDTKRRRAQIEKIVCCGIVMAAALILFKFIPMHIWGSEILFDASLHLTFAFWVLYIAWFFVDQTPAFHFPFFLLAILVLFIVSIQRIADNAHNDIGLLMGLAVSIVSIGAVEYKNFKRRIKF